MAGIVSRRFTTAGCTHQQSATTCPQPTPLATGNQNGLYNEGSSNGIVNGNLNTGDSNGSLNGRGNEGSENGMLNGNENTGSEVSGSGGGAAVGAAVGARPHEWVRWLGDGAVGIHRGVIWGTGVSPEAGESGGQQWCELV